MPILINGEHNILKMIILPKLIYRFRAIPIKILDGFFCRNWHVDRTIHIIIQGAPNMQNNLRKEQIRRFHISWFQHWLQNLITRSRLWFWLKAKIWKSMEKNWDFRSNLICMVNWLLTQMPRQQNRERIVFDKWYWATWVSISKEMELHAFLTPCTEINSKWILYLM